MKVAPPAYVGQAGLESSMKFTTTLTPPRTRFAGGYSSGDIDPMESADKVFGAVLSGPWLTCYMLRRFGWPNVPSDDHKNLCSWCLTTPVDGLCLLVTPYMGQEGGPLPTKEKYAIGNMHFGIRFSKEVGAELSRDPAFEKRWAVIEKAIRRWWDREGSDLYAFGVGEPGEVLVVEARKTEEGVLGLWQRPPKQRRQKLPAKAAGFLWWLMDFLEEKHPGVIPPRKPAGERKPTAFQRRAKTAIEATMKDLLRPVYVRDVGVSPLGQIESGKRYPSAEPFEGAGYTPEYWYSARRKRKEKKMA